MKLDEKIEELKKLGFKTIDREFVDEIESNIDEEDEVTVLRYADEENYILGKLIDKELVVFEEGFVKNASMEWFKEASKATSIYDEIFQENEVKKYID
ncbi:hypothetical protein UMC2_38611 [[Clostridium] sordellii]|uniref:hypothetical protein n=1 Tax=Paraclostridium sordellii TaxID=1505 RepID=UPI000542B7B7|nr:hypothetical protein [Paeniclostridium sordellii]CEK35973.1 hypothetical protein UMC2_38611 [[Clostridium] sordellii] [Paeniclostridium sordellii]